MSPFRRPDPDQEAGRWKQKFLDALEEHEQREKYLQQRISVLRRGLLGVSLAGDGVDDQLDRQLEKLRRLLRKNDQESGLEGLLEQIEASVLRLDSGRQEDTAALEQAIRLSLEQLRQYDLPREYRKTLQRFAREQERRGRGDDDGQQQRAAEFLALLRELIGALLADARETSGSRPGFWSRLFGASGPESGESRPSTAPESDEEDSAATAAESARPETSRATAASGFRPEPEPDTDAAPEPTPEAGSPADSGEIQGELLRGEAASGGLSEPGFSYIGDHVEPLLLRILENIHVAEQSARLVESVRETIHRGLNWYDFVAVLEDLVTLISQSRDEEREDFQQFLEQLNDNLGQVQSALLSTEQAQERDRAASERMDSTMRDQLDEMSRSVEQSDDLDQLKRSVRGQLDTIVSALDDYRQSRTVEDGDTTGLEGELRMLTRRVAAMEEESRTLREHLTRQQQNALRDKLTGLYNRDAWDRQVREACDGRARRASDPDLCMAVCDVDHFKQVNDRFGHLAGDRVLQVLARELERRTRESDFLARYGGEEFVILLPDTTLDDAEQVMEKLRHAVEQMPFHFRDDKVPVTVSCGLTSWRPGDGPEQLFERADGALYRAKKLGRNRCVVDRD